jgi:hypothetical protein
VSAEEVSNNIQVALDMMLALDKAGISWSATVCIYCPTCGGPSTLIHDLGPLTWECVTNGCELPPAWVSELERVNT